MNEQIVNVDFISWLITKKHHCPTLQDGWMELKILVHMLNPTPIITTFSSSWHSRPRTPCKWPSHAHKHVWQNSSLLAHRHAKRGRSAPLRLHLHNSSAAFVPVAANWGKQKSCGCRCRGGGAWFQPSLWVSWTHTHTQRWRGLSTEEWIILISMWQSEADQ